MTIPKIGPIHPVETLTTMLQKDESLKKEAINQLRKDFYAFVENTFELTPVQNREMRRKMPKEMAETVGHACIMALEHNGPIEFEITYDRHALGQPNIRIEVYCRGGPFECGVRITWEK